MIPYKIIGPPIAEYSGFQECFRLRADELGFSRKTIDRLAGLTDGLASKFLAPTPIKLIGPLHLGLMCAALAVRFVPIEDEECRAELERRLADRNSPNYIEKRDAARAMHASASIPSRSRRYMRRMQSSGGKARAEKLSPKRRHSIAKKAGQTRWRKVRAAARLRAELAASCA
jgi:hypothetical protein